MNDIDENNREKGNDSPEFENAEGRPWLLFVVAVMVLAFAFIAFFVSIRIATIGLVALVFVLTTLRLVMRGKSPWKVRSLVFDCVIGYAFSVGLSVTYISILMLQR